MKKRKVENNLAIPLRCGHKTTVSISCCTCRDWLGGKPSVAVHLVWVFILALWRGGHDRCPSTASWVHNCEKSKPESLGVKKNQHGNMGGSWNTLPCWVKADFESELAWGLIYLKVRSLCHFSDTKQIRNPRELVDACLLQTLVLLHQGLQMYLSRSIKLCMRAGW